jgi:peptidoglycan/LPS O-acetylase OafA/YrhL
MAAKLDIPALTGLRGAAALWVAAYHLLLPAGFVTGLAATALGRGYLAVDLFFVLSGFVMALSYGKMFRAGAGLQVFAGFMLRRLARLYPLYALILAIRFAYTALRYGTFDLPRPWIAAPMPAPALGIPANLLMIQSWGIASSSIGTAWSISTEWGAYFLFPALATLALWRGRRWAAGAVCAAAALIGVVAALNGAGATHAGALDAWDGTTAGPILRCLAGFTIGMVVFRAAQNPAIARFAGAAPCRWTLSALLLLAAATGLPDLAIYPLLPALVLSLACGSRRIVLTATPLIWLGEISYALYLLHIFALHPLDLTRAGARLILPVWCADAVAPVAIFAVLLAASHLAYRGIEIPGRALILRWGEALMAPRQRIAPVSTLTLNR